MNAKTAAQRQAERKARELAAGRAQWKRWVHPDDVPALTEYADKLARKRARAEQKAGITLRISRGAKRSRLDAVVRRFWRMR